MSFILSLLSPHHYFEYLLSSAGWLIWLALLAFVLRLVWRWRRFHPNWGSREGFVFACLILLVPFASLLFGMRLPPGEAPPFIRIPNEPEGAVIMLLAALPWMLAARYLGPAPAGLLAAFSGALIGYWDTHSLFTPLEYALIAVLFSAALRQRYRTLVYKFLRRPIVATLVVAFAYPIIYTLLKILTIGESLPVGVDFVSSRVVLITTAFTSQIMIGGILVEAIVIGWQNAWEDQENNLPAPSETSLETRILYLWGPILVVLFSALIAGGWIVAGRSAERLIKDQITITVNVAAESIPIILETGQSLILEIAGDERLLSTPADEVDQILQEHLRHVPYFRQLILLDGYGYPITGYPISVFDEIQPTTEEVLGIALAIQGVAFQIYSIPPVDGEDAGQISFIAALKDFDGNVKGVLLAHSSLASNPFTRPVIAGLDHLKSLDGAGMLVDPNGTLMYHPDSALLMTPYSGVLNNEPTFNYETAPLGGRLLTLNHPVSGRSWSVVAAVPTWQVQQQALNIAIPLLEMFALLALLTYGFLRFGLGAVTISLQGLAANSSRIAARDMEQPIPSDSTDEISQLGATFEDMRVSLKNRLEEINRLLFVSQGIVATLDLDSSVKPILEAALAAGATSARLVFTASALPELEKSKPTSFGTGPHSDLYAILDDKVIRLTQQREQVILSNPARAGLDFPQDITPPGALMALAVKHDSDYYGSLWLTYDEPHNFSEKESRFFSTLSDQAALAAANARLFHRAQFDRQRLEAVITSSTDPILVTDHRDRLLLANPAAIDLLRNGSRTQPGAAIEEVVHNKDLLNILLSPENVPASVEIEFPENRVYFVSASPVKSDGKSIGRVCLMHDITYFKELDAQKTEFVDTVSLDLRSPLKLMHGYATLIETVGDLNPQQADNLRKIVGEVERMSRLVNNLLDLGRIEAGVGLYLEKVQVVEITEQVLAAYSRRANQKNLRLSLEPVRSTIPVVEADKALLQQAIRNLLENAITYTNRYGEIKVQISSHQEGLLLSVHDNGIGIAPIDQPRIFERFFRVDKGGAESNGNNRGLGLAIVKSIAEQHGGKVWMESQLGSGSSFHLLIPYRHPIEEIRGKSPE